MLDGIYFVKLEVFVILMSLHELGSQVSITVRFILLEVNGVNDKLYITSTLSTFLSIGAKYYYFT